VSTHLSIQIDHEYGRDSGRSTVPQAAAFLSGIRDTRSWQSQVTARLTTCLWDTLKTTPGLWRFLWTQNGGLS